MKLHDTIKTASGDKLVCELMLKKIVRWLHGYRCAKCGITSEEAEQTYGRILHVHRLIPRSTYSVGKCVALCEHCHNTLPKSDYRGDNTVDPMRERIEYKMFAMDKNLKHLVKLASASYNLRNQSISMQDWISKIVREAALKEIRAAGFHDYADRFEADHPG